tara:strand:+ start:22 stop:474 length:453 start_codon:yes stop_codon:yes gene_type:complete
MSYITGILTSRIDTSQEWALGTIGQTSDGKLYKYMQWDDGSAAAAVAGEVAYYYLLDGYKTNIVTSDLSDSVEIGAGVIQAVMTDGQFGWFQIRGAATLTIALTAGADGDPLTPTGAGDGTLDVSAAVTDNVCAIAGDASDNEIVCCFPF